MEHLIDSYFLYDKGSGLEKERALQADIKEREGKWYIDLDTRLGFEPKLFCWTPFTYPAVLQLEELSGAQIVGHNAHRENEGAYTFILGDAFFYLKPEKDAKSITIVCKVRALDVCNQRELLREDAEICNKMQQELLDAQEQIDQLKKDLESVTNSTIWRRTEPLRRWKDGKKATTQDMGEENGLVRKYDEDTPIEELLYSSIDIIKIKDGLLTIEGWIICVEHEIRESNLLLEDDYGIRHQYDLELKGRRDVADTLGVRFMGDCGIGFCADYDSYSAQKILLRLYIDGTWYEIDTKKTIPPCPRAGGGAFYLEQYYDGEPPLDYWRFCQKNLAESDGDTYNYKEWKADIIVPVYNGMEYLPGLFAGIERTQIPYRLIIVDDCSPDEAIYPYLERYASIDERVILLRNESNLGFVKSVNRALDKAVNHVVLVNTDVELPQEWLERLLKPVYMDERVASVTPFSNSATIYSFPGFGKDNRLFMDLDVDAIDRVFAKVRPRNVSAPTGVGFCMAMNKDALRQIGNFDADTFGKGYGEENDWCQKAIEAGYRNVCAENLFVYHNHGGSFQSETKQRLLKENGAKLLDKHPDYRLDVEDFCRCDPNRDIRTYAKFELMFHSDVPMILTFDHDLGGGAAAYLDEKLALEMQKGRMTAIVRYNKIADRYRLKLSFEEYEVQIIARNREEIMTVLKGREYEQIWINELASYRELEQWLHDIVYLRKEKAGHLKMLIHDYFSVCPSLNLVDPSCRYCGVPKETEICAKCLSDNDYIYNNEYKDIVKWREDWGNVFGICDEIVAFSNDSKKRMEEVYPKLDTIKLIPHHVEPLPIVQKKKTSDTVNIGFLGAISGQKGLWIIKKMIAFLEEHNLGMHLVIIGEAAEELHSPVLTVTGKYDRDEIPNLTIENDVDVFFIPSIWPETFSYTTAEIMSMDMPMAVFDIGAPAERVRCYEKGLIIEDTSMEIEKLIMTLYQFAKRGEKECRQ